MAEIRFASFPSGPDRAFAAIVDAPTHDPDELLPTDRKLRRAVVQWLREHGDGNCAICQTPIDLALKYGHPAYAQLDHIKSRRFRGSDTWGNVQLAHATCNNWKKTNPPRFMKPAETAKILAAAVAEYEHPTIAGVEAKIVVRLEFLARAEDEVDLIDGEYVALYSENVDDPRLDELLAALVLAQKGVAREVGKLEKLEAQLAELQGESS